VSLRFANVQAQENSPMVTFNPPVHRPSITDPFHIILLDKKMVYLVWILGAWMVPSRLCVAILPTTHTPASGSFTEKRRRKCKLMKPKDCVEFTPTKIIVRYTERPAHTITIWSIGIIMPATHAETTVGIGPNHKDVTTAGYKASPKSVGVLFVFSLRFAAVGRICTHEEQGKWAPTRRAV
jgi:hypothetical protein